MLRYASIAALCVGLALMTMMIVVESEPGALPLLLVMSGCGGVAISQWRVRAARKLAARTQREIEYDGQHH